MANIRRKSQLVMGTLLGAALCGCQSETTTSSQSNEPRIEGQQESTAVPASPKEARAGNEKPMQAHVESEDRLAHSIADLPGAYVQLIPLDSMTSVGDSPLEVLVTDLGGANLDHPVARKTLASLAGSVALVTWPEMTPVPTTNSVENTDEGAADGRGHIHLSPVSPLADRWYAIRVTSLPAGIAWPGATQTITMPDGSHAARFRPGSEPVVSSVRICKKDGGKHAVLIDFSERVTRDSGSSAISKVEQLTGTANCVADPFPAGSSAMSVRFACTSLDEKAPLQLNVLPGLRSTSGPAAKPRALTLRPETAPSLSGCRTLRP